MENEKPDDSRHGKGLVNVMVYGTAIAFGGMGAFLMSLRDIRDDPSLVLSFWTIVGFVIGAALGFALWRVVWYLERRKG